MNKVRILFMPTVDAANTNAQSLNTREIALRLNPERLESSLWYEHEPDPRLRDRAGIRLLQLPARRKTFRILREQLAGYDLITYMDCSPASYLFLQIPRSLRRGARTVFHAEAPVAQLDGSPPRVRRMYEGLISGCDVHTAITDYVARDLEQAARVKAKWILPVGVDLRMFSPPAARTNKVLTVLFVGTLIERKGPQLVLTAAARFPEVRFRLIGSGRDGYELQLQRSIEDLGLQNVTLEGGRSQRDILQFMQESDILLVPSRLEGIPKVTLEAAATGLPCIVFSDYHTPSVLHGVTGFQVGSVDEMMKSLGELLEGRFLRERMGAEARKHAAQFDWDLVARAWESAYLAMASTRNV